MLSGFYSLPCEQSAWTLEAKDVSPVIITVPHDGSPPHDFLGFFGERKKGEKGLDSNVWPIVKDILCITDKASAVRGVFPRGWIDFNRPPVASQQDMETAFDDPGLKRYYDYYHGEVARLIKMAIESHGQENCLLMDFHGFVKQPANGEYDVILGTGKKTELEKTLEKFLSERGYRVLSEPPENVYGAGFTTLFYAKIFGIDAIQIEVAKRFRTFQGREIGQKLSLDMAEFLVLNFNL